MNTTSDFHDACTSLTSCSVSGRPPSIEMISFEYNDAGMNLAYLAVLSPKGSLDRDLDF